MSAGVGVKLSAFTIFVPYLGKYLVYNTLSRSFVTMGAELKALLDNPENPINAVVQPLSPQEEAKEKLNELLRVGILVSDDVDESHKAKEWYDKLRFDKSVMRAVILTTYNCNFACAYCVEDGVKSGIKMDEEHTHAAVDWLINRAQREGVKHILVVFYGGEPLLNVTPMEYISHRLKDYAEEHGVSFGFTITTNGSLLTKEIVNRLLPYGLSSVRITLDGDRDAHNSKRPFKSGKGSFDVIIENILKVADLVPIALGGNVDRENIDSIRRLLSYLEEKGLKTKLANVKFSPIVKTLGQTSPPDFGIRNSEFGIVSPVPHSALDEANLAPVCRSDGTGRQTDCVSLSESEVLDDLLSLNREVMKRGFKATTKLPVTICGMNQDGGLLVIDPMGKIYTCPAFVGRDGFGVGDISKERLNHRHYEFVNQELPCECLECVYLPLCGGGCRYAAYVKFGDCKKRICDKDYFEKLTTELLKFRYEYKFCSYEMILKSFTPLERCPD
jgi:uncharacterized protein